MRRSLIAIPVAVGVAVGVAGASGAFSSGNDGVRSAAVAASSTAAPTMTKTMAMPAAASATSGSLRLELHQTVVKVKIMNFAFAPARIAVSPGTRIVWTNEDSDPHTVTTDLPGFSSPALDTGQTFAQVLPKTGTFAYHCTIHPFMHGTVVVER